MGACTLYLREARPREASQREAGEREAVEREVGEGKARVAARPLGGGGGVLRALAAALFLRLRRR